MNAVREQYEQLPYPERNPLDEKKRLIIGSPSHPGEIDHYLFRGIRDWRKGTRILVAGGGTGDSTIMVASLLAQRKLPAEIHYLDLSATARTIAEERAKIRGLENIIFHTGNLLDAAQYGKFDYIDCCGVLHHLPNPQTGFTTLAKLLNEGGGMGGMVYAPLGRTGVYPLQQVLRTLIEDGPPQEKLAHAKKIVASLPNTNWFLRNALIGDHKTGDAGFYDLLLNAQDQPFTVTQLHQHIETAGLHLVGLIEPILYNPTLLLPNDPRLQQKIQAMSWIERAACAEKLSGTLKTHIFYASKAPAEKAMANFTNMNQIPRLKSLKATDLAAHIVKKGRLSATINGIQYRLQIPRDCATLIRLIDGRPLSAIAQSLNLDSGTFQQLWRPIHSSFHALNIFYYSKDYRGSESN